MNDKLNSIFHRRSIRAYTDKDIPDEMIQDLLEAAMAAPSACAADPWRFIIVKEKETLSKIAEGLPYGGMLNEAPLGMIVCGDSEAAHGNELSYMIQDCSAAIENLLIAADILGLGAVWLGVHPREDRVEHLKNMFSLPENIIPISAISIGWPESHPGARTRFKEDAVHYETW